MGYLTPILIRNDSAHAFLNKKMYKQICEKLYKACYECYQDSIAFNFPKGGIHCNAIESLGTSDACFDRLIVVHGNTAIDLSASKHIDECNDETHRRYLFDCIEVAESILKRLKSNLKESGITRKGIKK